MKKQKTFTIILVLLLSLTLAACDLFMGAESGDNSEVSSLSELSDPGTPVNTDPSSEDNFSVDDITSETSVTESSYEISDISNESSPGEISYDPGSVILVNGIIIADTRGMEQYGGGPKSAATYADYLNSFKQAVGDEVNVYSMPIPIASAFYAPENYRSSVNNHINTFSSLRDNLSDVKDINLLSALSLHTHEDIYSRTDHHWQALGAYYAAKELARVAGLPFEDLSNFKRESFSGFIGSFAGYTDNHPAITQNPEEFVYFVPNQDYTAFFYTRDNYKNPFEGSLFFSSKSYGKFIGGDSYITRVETGVSNGRKIAVFKDSYGNALAPFLISSFEEVYIIDIRYFKFNALDFIETQEITDVCFSLSAYSIVNSNGARVKDMAK